jgi:hypothetical protein
MIMEKKNGSFFKTLTFDREVEGSKEKVAYFVDKFDKDSKVITTWGGIVPKLRYSCQLEITDGKDDENEVIIYKLLKYRIWVDKLQMVTKDDSVSITLDGKEADSLTFDYGESTDYESKVGELKDYFRQKTFQLRSKEDIAKFITSYRKACEEIYNKYKKDVIKSFPKYDKKMEKIV